MTKPLTITDRIRLTLELSAEETPTGWVARVRGASTGQSGATFEEARRKAVVAALRSIAGDIENGGHLR